MPCFTDSTEFSELAASLARTVVQDRRPPLCQTCAIKVLMGAAAFLAMYPDEKQSREAFEKTARLVYDVVEDATADAKLPIA